jgi:uncharacterized protein (TIGR00255 family)
MIHSMTGYGQAETTIDGKNYRIEIRSINSKYPDIFIKMPAGLRMHEIPLRKYLAGQLKRGKIHCTVTEEAGAGQLVPKLNTEAIRELDEQIRTAFPGVEAQAYLPALLRLPEAWQHPEEDAQKIWEQLMPAIRRAAEATIAYRRTEGAEIEKDLRQKTETIARGLEAIEALDPQRIQRIRQRLLQAVKELKDEVDPQRFEQEVLYHLDRLDINEEKQRLRHHLQYFLDTLDAPDEEKGKKLNFIAQEMGREINTIGSKANDAAIQQHVVEMKDALEKIKEQTANIL